jgi:YVTN family beta-propeller protein
MKSLASLLLILGFASGNALAQTAAHVFVVNKAADSVTVVSAGSLRVEHTIPVGRNPHELAVAPNGSKLYVPNVAENSVSVIDLRTNSETKKITHADFNSPHGIAFTPDSGRAIVTSERSRKIFVLDSTTDRVLRVIDTEESGTHMATVNKAGTWAYLTNRESNTVSFMDLTNYRIVANVAVGRGAEGFGLSPDEKEIWVGNRSDSTISVIDVARRAAVATLPAGSNPIRLTFSPDGKYVLVSDGASGNVDVYDAATRRKIQSVAVGANPGGVVVSSDGKRAYVAGQGSNQIHVIDMQTWKVTDRVSVGANPDGIAYR